MKNEFYISLVGEAFDGYTEAVLDDKPAYIKHISLKDQRYLHKYYEKYKALALSKGLDSEEDRRTKFKWLRLLGEMEWRHRMMTPKIIVSWFTAQFMNE